MIGVMIGVISYDILGGKTPTYQFFSALT
jgi:hypothetical protein